MKESDSGRLSSCGEIRVPPLRICLPICGLLFAASLVSYLFFDAELAAWFNRHCAEIRRTDWMDAAKNIGRSLVPLWLLAVIYWVGGSRKAIHCGLAALIVAGLVVTIVKPTVGRPRPDRHSMESPIPPKVVEGFKDLSFPSGEATESFAMGIVFAAFLRRRWRAVPFVVAAYTASARAIFARHYLSDVLAGAAFGILAGVLALKLGEMAYRRWPFDWWKRRGFGFWIVVLFPLVDLVFKESRWKFVPFFKCYGALVVALLLVTRGRAWLRWLKGCRFRPFLPGDGVDLRVRSAGRVILLLAALAVIPVLSWSSLFDGNEGACAECAREMIDGGNPAVPHLHGELVAGQAPLAYDAIAGSMLLFGANEFGARLPAALLGLLAIWMTLRLARRLCPGPTGAFAAALLATSVLFTMTMRHAQTEMPLLCAVLLAMTGLACFLDGEERKGFVLFFVGCGLGFLARGVLGAALPVAALLGYAFLARRTRLLLEIRPLRGTLLALLVALPWIIPALMTAEGGFVGALFERRSFLPDPSFVSDDGGILTWLLFLPFYIPVTLIAFSPWSVFLVGSFRDVRRETAGGDRGTLLLAGWIAAQLVLISLVGTRAVVSVLPLLPALAILAGRTIAGRIDGGGSLLNGGERKTLLIGGLLLSGLAAFAPFFLGLPHTTWLFLPCAAAILLVTVGVRAHAVAGRSLRAVSLLAGGVVLTAALLSQVAFPALEEGKPARALAASLNEKYPADELDRMRIGASGYDAAAFPFYLNRTVERVGEEEIGAFLRSSAGCLLVLPERRLARAVASGMEAPYRVVHRETGWSSQDRRLEDYVVLEGGGASSRTNQNR